MSGHHAVDGTLGEETEKRLCGHPVAWIVFLLSLVTCLQVPDARTAQPTSSPSMAAVAVPDDDITKVNLLARGDFRGDKVVVFGVRLGQTLEEAQRVIQANPELAIEETVASGRGFFVLDRGGPATKDRAILRCLWSGNDPGLVKLVIYPRIARFLPAGSERLFAARSTATMPPDVKGWLGPEDRAVVTVHGRATRVTTHVFEKRALEVSDFDAIFAPQSVSVTFTRPSLLERERPSTDVDPRWVVIMMIVMLVLFVLPLSATIVQEVAIWRNARAKASTAGKSPQSQK